MTSIFSKIRHLQPFKISLCLSSCIVPPQKHHLYYFFQAHLPTHFFKMKKIYKLVFLSFSFIIFHNAAFTQTWQAATWTPSGTCTGNEPTILKVFVDACYEPESKNEFIYMKTSAAGWDYSNFSMKGGAGGNTQPMPLINCSGFGGGIMQLLRQREILKGCKWRILLKMEVIF